MINNRHIRAIVEYLNGGMTPDERQAFQRRLESDEKLRQILGQEQQIDRALLLDKETIPILGAPAFDKFLLKLNTSTAAGDAGHAAQQRFDSALSKGSNGFGNKSMLIGLALVGLTAGGMISAIVFEPVIRQPVPPHTAPALVSRPTPPSAPSQATAPVDSGNAPAVVMEHPARPYSTTRTATADRQADAATRPVGNREQPDTPIDEEDVKSYLKRQDLNTGVHTVGDDSVHARFKVGTSK
ncbi:MAG: hypothetical protein JWQ98_1603 [Chlorobi bacterium]|nr:hypothetical protein [Chlorobiota bacterium]